MRIALALHIVGITAAESARARRAGSALAKRWSGDAAHSRLRRNESSVLTCMRHRWRSVLRLDCGNRALHVPVKWSEIPGDCGAFRGRPSLLLHADFAEGRT